LAYCESFMKEAIALSLASQEENEVPVGAVIVKDGQIISTGQNRRERTKNALAHAEIVAINGACEVLGNWRLSGCDLYVTLEPCPMCAGAIFMARMQNIYFGAYDRENGAFCQGMLDIVHKQINVYGGICEEECARILTDFFKKKRS